VTARLVFPGVWRGIRVLMQVSGWPGRLHCNGAQRTGCAVKVCMEADRWRMWSVTGCVPMRSAHCYTKIRFTT